MLGSKQKRKLRELITAACLYAAVAVFSYVLPYGRWFAAVMYLPVYLWIARPVISTAVKNLRHRDFLNENFLMLIATAGALVIQEYSEAVAVMLFYQAGEFLQDLAVERSRQSVAALMDIVPESARVVRSGAAVEISPEQLCVGDEIEVRAGEKFPVDCIVTSGESAVDTASLTGESIPVAVMADSEVLGGAINGGGLLRARVVRRYEDSAVSRILELVENASEKKARTERFITRFARWYTPAVIVAALLMALVPVCLGGFGVDWAHWLYRSCMFLVVSCPCALVISVPMGFFCGIGAASRHGILVKGGTALENAASLDTMVFDKTGTLTGGRFEVGSLCSFGLAEDEFRRIAASLEQGSNHPVAQAIRRDVAGVVTPEECREVPGKGVVGVVENVRYGLGNAQMLALFDAPVPGKNISSAGTAVYLCTQGRCLGYMVLEDAVRSGASGALRKLRRMGVRRMVLLTGDRPENARYVADSLGFEQCHASLLPQDKVAVVERLLQDGHRVAFTGDGINDAPVLMRSTLGIAMGGIGSDAAIEAADVVLVSDRLSRLPLLRAIARKTVRIVRENIALALGAKLLVLVLGVCGIANMWWAIFADVGVALLAIANAGRAFVVREL